MGNKPPCSRKYRPILWLVGIVLCSAAPKRGLADAACNTGDTDFARPVAELMQPYVSVFNPLGEVQVTVEFNGEDLSTVLTLHHLFEKKEVFRVNRRLEGFIEVKPGILTTTEGVGFTLQTTAGGTGYGEICTYGFRFIEGAVEYRTLMAKAVDVRSAKEYPGPTSEWSRAAALAVQQNTSGVDFRLALFDACPAARA